MKFGLEVICYTEMKPETTYSRVHLANIGCHFLITGKKGVCDTSEVPGHLKSQTQELFY